MLQFLLPNFNPGGAETVMIRIANGLHARNHTINIVVCSDTGDLRSEISAGIQVIDLKTLRVRHAALPLLRAIRRERPQAVLSTLGRMNTLLLALKPALGETRIYVREANTPSIDLMSGNHHPALRWLYPRIYPRADKIICQSQAMKRDFVDNLGIADHKLECIYNPAPQIPERLITESPFPGEERQIVFCGRLSEQKAPDCALRTFAKITSEFPDARLNILGDGPMLTSLRDLAASLDLEEKVIFWGHRKDRFRFFFFADVTLSTSRWEGLPNVLIESLSCATPVVATRCAGTTEVVENGCNGFLAPIDEVSVLAQKLSDVLRGTHGITSASIAASMQKFDQNRIIEQYEHLLF